MISWIQTLLHKHYKWLFSGLLAIIIVAFVFTIGNTGGIGSGNQQDIKLEYFGVNLNAPRQMQALQQDAVLSSRLNGTRLDRSNIEAVVFQRITALYLANQLNIPAPNEKQLSAYIPTLGGLKDPQTGKFSTDIYTRMVDEVQNSPQSGGEQALLNVLSDDYRIEKVTNALGGPGYVLPYIAKLQSQAMDTVWSVEIANYNRASYNPDIQPTDAQLETFYKDNEFRFATGPRVVVGYIDFPASEFTSEIEDPTAATLLSYYRTVRGQFLDDEGKPKPLEDVKADVVASWKKDKAKEKAVDAANKFAVSAYEASYAGSLEANSKSITAFADKHGKKLTTLAPFPREEPASSVPGVPAPALAQAADLNTTRFYTDGVMIDDGAAVFFLEEELPSTTPALADIRDEVTTQYVAIEKRRMFSEHSQKLAAKIKASVGEGKSFSEEAKSLGFEVQSFKDFTFASPPQGMDYILLQSIQGMKSGEVSDLIGFGTTATVIYVADKQEPEFTLDSDEVKDNIQEMARFTARATSQGIINELIAKEDQRVHPQEF